VEGGARAERVESGGRWGSEGKGGGAGSRGLAGTGRGEEEPGAFLKKKRKEKKTNRAQRGERLGLNRGIEFHSKFLILMI
jgi:hypothetical protein